MSTSAENEFQGTTSAAVLIDPARPEATVAEPRTRWRAIRDTVGAVVGAVLGLVPHVMHHVGLLAGAAVVTGAAGNALLFGVGLVFSVPLLLRLYRRFRTWHAPAIAVAVFATLFSLSAFVIGPAISGGTTEPAPASPAQVQDEDHAGHHPDE